MNAHHRKLLKESVAAWNEWRRQNPQIQPDLSREPFSFAHLTGADLIEFDMSASLDLSGADLSGANLAGQDLITANLTRANLSGAKLNETELRHANLSGAKLNGADLTGADLTEAEVTDADFSEALLDGTRLEGAIFNSSTIWPSAFDPILRGAQKRSGMDFALKKGIDIWNRWRSRGKVQARKPEDEEWNYIMQQVGAFNQQKSKERMPEPNQEHLNIAWQGSGAWDRWRERNPAIRPELSAANLSRINLSGANLEDVLLRAVDLRGADLSGANLSGAILTGADLSQADLTEADLHGATLIAANFRRAVLRDADFTGSLMHSTVLADVDLRKVRGLEAVIHDGPSSIGIDTILRFRRSVPEETFLRGVGVPEPFIANMSSLIAAMSPIEFYSCFISYSNKDHEFAARLHADLQSKGVRCWFAPEDLKIGDKMRPSFDEAIRVHDKVMVLLSESSVKSHWVEKEVETAFEKERQQNRTVLFPIRLDHAVLETQQAWAADIRRTRHIGDFCNWKAHDSYKKAFDRLLRDLKAESETESSKQE